MAIIGQGVSLHGMTHNDFHYPFLLDVTVTKDDVGKPVAFKPGTANTVIVAPDGAQVIGKLVTFEDRAIEGIRVGTVTLRGGFSFEFTGTLAPGDTAVGAGGGRVKRAAQANHADNIVVEVSDGRAVIVR